MSIFSNECEKCGAQVKKRAKFCSSCGQPGPKAWVKCGACNKWIGAESEFCPHCKKAQHVGERNLVSNNQINREAGVFVQRIDVDDIRDQVKDFLIIEHGTCVVFMENGKIKNLLEQGKHTINDGFLKSIFSLGSKSFKSFFVIESGDIALPFEGTSLHSLEDMKLDLYTEAVFRFDKDNGANLIENLLKDRRQLKYDELGELLNVEILDSIKSLTNVTSIDTLIKDSNVRLAFENKLSDKLRDILKSIGIKLHRIASIDFYGEDYEKLRNIAGDIELKARETALNQRLKELMVSEQMNYIKSEFDLKMYEEQLIHEYNVNKEILSFERQEIITDLKEKLLLRQNEFNRGEDLKDHSHNIELGVATDIPATTQRRLGQEGSEAINETTSQKESFRSQRIESEPLVVDSKSVDINDDKHITTEECTTQKNETQSVEQCESRKESCCCEASSFANPRNIIIAIIVAAIVIIIALQIKQSIKQISNSSTDTTQNASTQTAEMANSKKIKGIDSALQKTEDELEKMKKSYKKLNTLRSAQLKEAVKKQEQSSSAMKDIERRLAVAQAELETRDSDKDGILDKIEKRLKLDPNNPNDAMQDSDKDGFSNKEEILGAKGLKIFARSTNHLNPLDHPALAHRLKLLPPKKQESLFEIKEITLTSQGKTATVDHKTQTGRKTITVKERDTFEVDGKTYTIIGIQPRKKMIFNKALWKELEVTVGELEVKSGSKTQLLYKGNKVTNNKKDLPVVEDTFTGNEYELSEGSEISIGDKRTGIEEYKVSKIADHYVKLIDKKTQQSIIIHP